MHRTPLIATLALSSCWWTAPSNDAGDEAFVTQAVEAILGRKPRGAAEIRALADLAATSGREAVVDALFAEPDYVAYWSQVLADDLQVQRAGWHRVAPDCTAPALLPPSLSGALAGHLATQPPDAPFCVWSSGAAMRFDADDLERAVEAATGQYDGTFVDDLETPSPMKDPPRPGKIDRAVVSGETGMPDLELEGTGASNADFVSPLEGPDPELVQVDLKRWAEQRDWAGGLECPPFNLTDAIEASVRADRIDAAYRAYLPVLGAFGGGGEDAAMRSALGAMFLDVYLDRDTTCMTCHSATWSTTDPRPRNRNWDRFDPIWFGLDIPLDAEGTVFSYDTGGGDFVYGGDGGADARSRVDAFFRADNLADGGLVPWGIDDACVTDAAWRPGRRGYDTALPPDPRSFAAFGGAGPGDALGVLDLVDALSRGTSTFDSLWLRAPDWAAYRSRRPSDPAHPPPVCVGCHNPDYPLEPKPPPLEEVVPMATDARLFSIVRYGSGAMRAVATESDGQAWDAVRAVRAAYPRTPAVQMVGREHGFVFLLAANVTNQVVDEVLGEDLTMAHGFPRNPDQARALSVLATTFASGFSLKALLKELVMSEAFNRRPPVDAGTAPYVLPMLPFPEAESAPYAPDRPLGSDANSEGDFVHRHSPGGLLHQVHAALGWPGPHVAEAGGVYPSASLSAEIGRYSHVRDREDPHVGLADLTAWEEGVATCRKPSAVLARDVTPAPGLSVPPTTTLSPYDWVDWIDVLAADAEARGDRTWLDLASAVKDRLLADPRVEGEELVLLPHVFQVHDLGESPVGDGAFSDDEEGRLRDYCSALMRTPQFLLRGLRLAPPLPEELAEPVCLPDEICGADALYQHYELAVPKQGGK